MNFFSKFLGNFFRAYDAATPSDERREPPLIVADARRELTSNARLALINKARNLVRNYGLAREIVGGMETYSVGDGIFPQASTASEAWNDAAEKLFRTCMQRPTTCGRFSFGKLTRLACRALDVDGEIFFVKIAGTSTTPPRLQVFEAHRVAPKFDAEKRIFDGIAFDASGAPSMYFFLDDAGAEIALPAEFVIHVFLADRASDAHGKPQIQHAINTLTDSRELLATEKKAVKLINELTLGIESERNSDAGASSGAFIFGAENAVGETDPDALKRQIGGGKILKLLPGEKLHEIASTRPATTFTGFLDFNAREACLGNLPFEFVADSSKIGGAGVRLVVGRAARVFAQRQQEIIEQFLVPVWRFFIAWAVREKKLDAVDDLFSVEWACPKKVTVDAGREAAQDRADVEGGFTSLADYYAERGMDFKREVRRVASSLALAKKTADEFGVAPASVARALANAPAPVAPAQNV